MNDHRGVAESRARMIDDIVAAGHAQNPAVRAALTRVPRDRFIPDVSTATAYDCRMAPNAWPRAVAGPHPGTGIAPVTAAMMLDQLDVRPGHHVLHVGTGTGYTAALLAELTDARRVVTVDDNHQLTEQARETLDNLGYGNVEVTAGPIHDTRHPYDRIIVTASVSDLPRPWIYSLAPEGRIVVPLRLRGTTRSTAFQKHNGILQAHDSQPCPLPRLRGRTHELQHTTQIGPQRRLTLTWDEDQRTHFANHGVPHVPLENVRTKWSGVTIAHGESHERLWMHLAAARRGIGGLTAAGDIPGLPPPAVPAGTPALLGHGSVAYLILKEILASPTGTRRYQLGVAAYGHRPTRHAATYVDHIRAWDLDRTAHPTITVLDGNPPQGQLPPGEFLRRPSCTLVLSPAGAT
jgi:protein-L-isoaspartate(D-aspartate) O-methyltransferase